MSFSSEVQELWNGWLTRLLVIISLILQIILVGVSGQRKKDPSIWIRFTTWLTYVLAMNVASVALGNLTLKGGNSFDPIQAFWAPFLILHLAGPDSITAYSLDDNNLWQRTLLSLLSQFVVAFYVYVKLLGSNSTTLAWTAILVFIPGLIRYAERNRSQMVASCLQDYNWEFIHEPPSGTSSVQYIREAHWASIAALSLFSEDEIEEDAARNMKEFVMRGNTETTETAKRVFRLVETELSFIYDWLYTKFHFIKYPKVLFLRSVTFLSCFCVLIVFSALIGKQKQAYSSVADITITVLLLVGAVVQEIYSFVILLLSDWAIVRSLEMSGSRSTCAIINSIQTHFAVDRKRWSGKMGQLSIIKHGRTPKPNKTFHNLLGREELRTVFQVKVDDSLKSLMYKHIRKQSNVEQRSSDSEREPTFFQKTILRVQLPDSLRRIIETTDAQIHKFTENLKSGANNPNAPQWLQTQKIDTSEYAANDLTFLYGIMTSKVFTFSYNLLLWHIVTDLCYYHDQDHGNDDHLRENSKRLSHYLMYVYVMNPGMHPTGSFGVEFGGRYKNMLDYVRDELSNSSTDSEACEKLLREGTEERLIGNARRAARILNGDARRSNRRRSCKWEFLSHMWVEMLLFAAMRCKWKEHALYLARGGELLTHAALLVEHFCVKRHYFSIDYTPATEGGFVDFGFFHET